MADKTKRVLVIDDEEGSIDICTRVLSKHYTVVSCDNIHDAEALLSKESFDCILTDLVMPDVYGLEFVEKLQQQYPDTPKLLMSGKATVKVAVEAMKLGIEDVIEKPIENLEFLTVYVEKALNASAMKQENRILRQRISRIEKEDFVGNSPAMQKVMDTVKKIATLNSTILIHGETGTGKERLARLIHNNSTRADKTIVAVNCGAVPDTLLESLLFGHAKGSFTGAVKDSRGYFEEADGGTLFLDEIGETSLAFQVKLLRVLQERVIRRVGDSKDIPIDVRIIAATNKNLEIEVQQERFRKDLYYRLNVIKIEVPALRDRRDDIPLLAKHFLGDFMNLNNLKGYKFSQETIEALKNAHWDGNIRELQNAVEHAAAMCSEGVVQPADLPSYLLDVTEATPRISWDKDYNAAKEHFEKIYFTNLYRDSEKKMTKVAEKSGLSRQYLYDVFKRLGIDIKEG